MVSKESLIMIAIMLVLAMSFFVWSQDTTANIQSDADNYIRDILKP